MPSDDAPHMTVLKRRDDGSLLAEQIRCPDGCAFRLLPLDVDGWASPSAETKAIRSLELQTRSQGLPMTRFEVRVRGPTLAEPGRVDKLETALKALVQGGGGGGAEEDGGDGPDGLTLNVLETRGAFVVFEIDRKASVTAASKLLGALAEADIAQPTGAVVLEPSAGLLEILENGTAVRRGLDLTEEQSTGFGRGLAWLLLLCMAALGAIGLSRHRSKLLGWRGGVKMPWRQYETVQAGGFMAGPDVQERCEHASDDGSFDELAEDTAPEGGPHDDHDGVAQGKGAS